MRSWSPNCRPGLWRCQRSGSAASPATRGTPRRMRRARRRARVRRRLPDWWPSPIGSDTGGSIIQPSARNGITGLRPTFGRVSRYGAMALAWTQDTVGPMCRSAEDCALVFDAIYGPDGKDNSILDVPFGWDAAADVTKLRVGYLRSAFDDAPPGWSLSASQQLATRRNNESGGARRYAAWASRSCRSICPRWRSRRSTSSAMPKRPRRSTT